MVEQFFEQAVERGKDSFPSGMPVQSTLPGLSTGSVGDYLINRALELKYKYEKINLKQYYES
jgi:hypothetical protein